MPETKPQGNATAERPLLRIHVRGLQIDAQCGKGGVVNLAVRADQQHKGLWRRLFKHLSNALFRAGDACDPSNHHGAMRVVHLMVPSGAFDDGQSDGAALHARNVWPIHSSNGDAHYQALLIHEGVKRRQDGHPAFREFGWGWWKERADDGAHWYGSPLKEAILPAGSVVMHDRIKGA